MRLLLLACTYSSHLAQSWLEPSPWALISSVVLFEDAAVVTRLGSIAIMALAAAVRMIAFDVIVEFTLPYSQVCQMELAGGARFVSALRKYLLFRGEPNFDGSLDDIRLLGWLMCERACLFCFFTVKRRLERGGGLLLCANCAPDAAMAL